ncbi:MAG: 1,4-dihydroxy-2-naphthoate octaprenyltransferase [Bacteroidales bacterium]|nr:1,4-dihydroxy-2-naphthoate octaprenyltransferase [Bacteroidales bacterium]
MRLRTLPLSLAGVVCGGLLAMGGHSGNWWAFGFVLLTACLLQVLSNLSNEMGDHLSGVDGKDREGPAYGMADGLTEKQLWRAINGMVVVCCLSGLAMVIVSGSPWWVLVVGAAAIWAATHYTLGKKPYGYFGLGDLFVFIFFGLVSVLGSYFVLVHRLEWHILLPACGIGLLSVAVLNVNNIRDMQSDEGIRKTIPLRIGRLSARWYQTALIVIGVALMCVPDFNWWLCLPVGGIAVHLWLVWNRQGKRLDPALPILVISTFLLSLLYVL